MTPDEIEARRAEKLSLLSTVAADNFALAIAMNVAANGRQFCTLVFAACIAAYLKTGSALFALLAIVAALPIGLAVLSDISTANGRPRASLSVAAYALATVAAFSFVFAILLG